MGYLYGHTEYLYGHIGHLYGHTGNLYADSCVLDMYTIQKSAAMKELQNTVVDLSLNIAEKLLSKELDNKEKQLENIQDILDKTKLN